MKILIVFIFLYLCSLSFLTIMDLISGITFSESVLILFKSFSVITTAEKVIVFVAVFIPFLFPAFNSLNKSKKTRTK